MKTRPNFLPVQMLASLRSLNSRLSFRLSCWQYSSRQQHTWSSKGNEGRTGLLLALPVAVAGVATGGAFALSAFDAAKEGQGGTHWIKELQVNPDLKKTETPGQSIASNPLTSFLVEPDHLVSNQPHSCRILHSWKAPVIVPGSTHGKCRNILTRSYRSIPWKNC